MYMYINYFSVRGKSLDFVICCALLTIFVGQYHFNYNGKDSHFAL